MTLRVKRLTLRKEYSTKCNDLNCHRQHGPYIYAYWKSDGCLYKTRLGRFHKDDQYLLKSGPMKGESIEIRTLDFMRIYQYNDRYIKFLFALAKGQRRSPNWVVRQAAESIMKNMLPKKLTESEISGIQQLMNDDWSPVGVTR